MTDKELQGKIAIVTGGARGIGEAITTKFAEEGASVSFIDKNQELGESLTSSLRKRNLEVNFYCGDLTDHIQISNFIQSVVKKYHQIDILVNNAGINDKVGLEAGPLDFRESLKRNLYHYYDMAHYALPYLLESQGVILNISSKVAEVGQGGTSGYAAAKGGIIGLTKEWAADLAKHGIRVNCIVPAEVETPLYKEWLDTFPNPEAKKREIVNKIPLGNRMTTPEEIAQTALFLVSARSSHFTGEILHPNGGYYLDRALI